MILSISENFNETYINEGTHGVVVKCKTFKNEENKEKNIFEEGAIKLNIKYKSEKVVGISSLKELSFLLSISSPCIENTFTIKLNDFIFSELFEPHFIKNILNKICEGKKKEFDKIHFRFDYYKQDLTKFIKLYPVNENLLRNFSEDMSLGLYWCYLNKIVHRDFKMCNILVCEDKKLKICDFGLAGYLKKVKNNKTSSPGVTSYYFRSPEVHNKDKKPDISYDYKIDYWALGIVFLNLVYICSLPPESKKNLLDLNNIDRKKKQEDIISVLEFYKKEILERKKYSEEFIQKYFDLIKQLIVLDPEKRYDIKKILKADCFDKNKIKIHKKLFKEQIRMKKEERKTKINKFLEDKKNFYIFCDNKIKILKKKILLYCLYLSLNKKKFFWYKDEIIYHSLYTFDKFCVQHYIDDKNDDVKIIFNKEEEEDENLSFVYILYMFYKFFSTLINIDYKSFMNSLPTNLSFFHIRKGKISQENIEKQILDMYGLQLYEKTDFEKISETIENFDDTSKLKEIEKYFTILVVKKFSPLESFILNEFFSL